MCPAENVLLRALRAFAVNSRCGATACESQSKPKVSKQLHTVGRGWVGQEIDSGIFHGGKIHGDLLARGAGVRRTVFVAQLGFRFPEPATIRFEARDTNQWLADGDLVEETDVEFSRQAELFLGRRRGPEHRFVEDRGQNSAVDDAAEAGVLRLRREVGAHFVAFAAKTEAESMWIVRAADEAVARVGECEFAHFMKTLRRRPAR